MSATTFGCVNMHNDIHPNPEAGLKGHYQILAGNTNPMALLANLRFLDYHNTFCRSWRGLFTLHRALYKAHFPVNKM
jgi:hypothetical protein